MLAGAVGHLRASPCSPGHLRSPATLRHTDSYRRVLRPRTSRHHPGASGRRRDFELGASGPTPFTSGCCRASPSGTPRHPAGHVGAA
eukprot:1455832-Alexandrium_andersonii.AAC.1